MYGASIKESQCTGWSDWYIKFDDLYVDENVLAEVVEKMKMTIQMPYIADLITLMQ